MLEALTFRRVPDVSFLTATAASLIAAIQSAFGATVYSDGTTRTAGAGRAWSISTSGADHLLVVPPTGGPDCAVLLAAAISATPKMLSPDTFLASALLGAVAKEPGTFTSWDGSGSSDPLGAGAAFSGYTRITGAATAGTGVVCLFEAAAAIVLAVKVNATWFAFAAGALLDPDSTDPADAEDDGSLYGLFTSGSGGLTTTFDSATSGWLQHSVSLAGAHAYYLIPGSTTWRAITAVDKRTSASGASSAQKASGAYVLSPRSVEDTTSGAWTGLLRGLRRGPQGRSRRTVYADGEEIAFQIGASDTADCDCIHIMAQ